MADPVSDRLHVAPVDGLADRFRVSQEAMQWRLFNFQLVAERPA